MNAHDESSTNTNQRTSWRALEALAIGLLLGGLATMPYDQVLGVSGLLSTALQSAISVSLLTALAVSSAPKLNLKPLETPVEIAERGVRRDKRRDASQGWNLRLRNSVLGVGLRAKNVGVG